MALRGANGVAAKTRERVLQVARELGYEANPEVNSAMRSLRFSSHHRNQVVVGYVAHDSVDTLEEGATMVAYTRGIRRRAKEMGFEVKTFCRANYPNDIALSRDLSEQGIEYLIVAPIPPGMLGTSISLDWTQFLSVTLGNSIDEPVMHRACANHFDGAELAYATLVAKGCQRIALAMSRDEDRRAGGKWHGGFLHGFSQSRLLEAPSYLPNKWTRKGFSRWMKQVRPDAILCVDACVLDWVKSEGYSIPGDVSLALLSMVEDAADKGWSGVCYDYSLAGEAAVNLIVGAMLDEESGVPSHERTVQISGFWVEGETG